MASICCSPPDKRAGGLMPALGQHRKHRIDFLEILFAQGAGARQHRAHRKIFGNRQRREHLTALRHLADAEIADLMARPAGDVQCRDKGCGPRAGLCMPAMVRISERLAGAVGADNRDDRALFDLERDAIERLRVAVKHIEIFDAEHQATASAPR